MKASQELIKPSIQRDVNTNERMRSSGKGRETYYYFTKFWCRREDCWNIKGPTVTRFEIQPNAGVKVSKIVSLADDIALNLAATGVRIEAPIPGKAAIGIEVPNKEVDIVYLHDVLSSSKYIKLHPSYLLHLEWISLAILLWVT